MEEYVAIVERLQAIAAEVPVDAPWTTPNAREWDSQTLHAWLKSNGASPATMQAFDGVSDLWGNEPRDMSLLYAAYYVAAAGDPQTPGTLARLLDIHDGAQELRFLGGSQLIPIRIAEELGDSVVLSAPVRKIAWDGGTVRVTADGHTVEARRVIVAIPPALAGSIQYTPQIPTPRVQLYQRWPMGSLVKTTTIYDRPFWRDEGLSGSSMLAGRVLRSTFDNTPDSGEPGAILGFVSGTRSRGWSQRPEDERRADVIADLVDLFGEQAGEPIDYFEQDWPSEEWSRGGPVAYMGPGVLIDYGSTMREPVGPIHWAGTETATYWTGYMEGAVQSGERAAQEALEALGPA
jgi:monoamine oxidase